MPHSLSTIHIMPVDWDHPAWVGVFYPDDLPEDWRLSYFANEFSEVLVPQVSWVKAGLNQLQSWIDDISDNFRFFLGITDQLEISLCEKQAETLDANFGGFVLSESLAGEVWWEGFVAMCHRQDRKVFLSRDASMLDPNAGFSNVKDMWMALSFKSEDLGDLIAQRRFFERLQENTQSETQVLLYVEGTPSPIESIKKLRQLAQLMGFA